MVATKLGFMWDIESLDLGSRSVVTQIAFVCFPLDDPETIIKAVSESLPIQPQLALNRTVSADTIIWWMGQNDEARARFKENGGNDMDELFALVRSVTRKWSQCFSSVGQECENWARGPQFDMVNIESLIVDCGEKVPWKYYTINDLRTLMRLAGLKSADVTKAPGLVDHVALDDCKFQIACYVEAIKQLRSHS